MEEVQQKEMLLPIVTTLGTVGRFHTHAGFL